MNEIDTTRPSLGLIPTSMDSAIRLAEMMARGKMMPEHLRNPGDALMVVEQAMRWQMSPFAVAQATFSIRGKLGYAGTIVHAAIEGSGAIKGLIDYRFSGEGPKRAVTVSAIRIGEAEPRTVEVALKEAETENVWWKKTPDQMLCYHGARVWARRWTPGVMLGVYSREELLDADDNRHGAAFSGTTIDATATEQPKAATPRAEPEKPRKTWAVLLDEIELALSPASAPTRDDVDLVIASEDVQRALDKARNGARDRLDAIISAAMARTDDEQQQSAPATDAASEASVLADIASAATLNALRGIERDGAFAAWVAALPPDARSRIDAALVTRWQSFAPQELG